MAYIIPELLEETAKRLPDKPAYVDPNRTMTFSMVRSEAMRVGQGLINEKIFKKPVVVFVDKSAECITAVYGVTYSGNFYTVMDTSMPRDRIQKILDTLEPEAFVTTSDYKEKVLELAQGKPVLVYEELMKTTLDEKLVLATVSRILPTDLLYVIFTSGSTGIPKGVATTHMAVVYYMTTTFGERMYWMEESDSILSQVPFYFVMSMMDMFGPATLGLTTHIVPASYYSFPAMLVKYIEEQQITVLNWVPSVLQSIVTLNAFEVGDLSSIRRIFFGGEVMPPKVIKAWRENAPYVRFLNGYGSTELTDGCISYIVEGIPDADKSLPIGKPNPNMDILLLDENDRLVEKQGEIGEICARSPSIATGYYNDPERTAEVFVQNPLNKSVREIIFRTGDLAYLDENNDYIYIGRKDNQIKYMGYRIELGEIEANISAVSGVEEAACIYDREAKHIIAYYTGSIMEKELGKILKGKLPDYMLPRKRIRLEDMPHNVNGKIDRVSLRKMYSQA